MLFSKLLSDLLSKASRGCPAFRTMLPIGIIAILPAICPIMRGDLILSSEAESGEAESDLVESISRIISVILDLRPRLVSLKSDMSPSPRPRPVLEETLLLDMIRLTYEIFNESFLVFKLRHLVSL